MRPRLFPSIIFALALFLSGVPALAQGGQGSGSITIYVRNELGEPLTIPPQITITSNLMGMPVSNIPQQTGDDGWLFDGLTVGDEYEIQVRAEGYRPAFESVSLPAMEGSSTNVIIFVRPLGNNSEFQKPTGQFVLAPRAEKEVEHGLNDLRNQKFDSARKHFQKAMQMAPGNPYVNYVMGMVYLLSKQAARARPYLERSVSIDPKQPPSLLALGTARFQTQDYSGAVQILQEAVQLDATSWKAEWVLAGSYLRLGNYAKARDYAQQALRTGKQNASPVQLLLAEAFAGLGEREQAAKTFEDFLRRHPKDPNNARIRGYVETLRQPLAPAVVPVAADSAATLDSSAGEPRVVSPIETSTASPAPPVDLPPKENWAPPDIDAARPFVISGAACSLPNVLQAAGKNAAQLVSDLQEFSAIEEYQSVEIKHNEQLETPETRTFNYLVLIDELRPGLIHVEESRETNLAAKDVPGPLHDEGAPARVLVFHPTFRNDFDWDCEGLGEWNDKPAWVVHFAQRQDRPTSRLAGFSTPSQLYLLPLKGRAWISENGGHVMHLETDLTRSMPELGLLRQHFAINYSPVMFQSHKVELWLPESVDVYYEFRRHYFHNYHHYTNFRLFWVGASEKMGHPKEAKQN